MFKNAMVDTNRNKNIGMITYLFHRITGIGLVIYLIMHTYVLSSAISGEKSFNGRMGFVQSPFFAILEVLLIAGVFFHLLNGARITICDFAGLTKSHKAFFWIEAILFVAIMILTIILQIPKMQSGYYTGM